MRKERVPTLSRFLHCAAGALTLAVVPGAGPPRPAAGDPLDYVQAAQDLLQRHGMDPASLGPGSFHEVMERACAVVDFGQVRLYVPKEGFLGKEARGKSYPEAADTLRMAVPAVMRSLSQMARWGGAAGLEEKDLAALSKMIEIAKDFDLASLAQPLTLAQLLGKDVDKREQAVLDALAAVLAVPQLHPSVDGKAPPPVPVLVLPTRREMIEYLCLAGLVEPTMVNVFHTPAITGWMHSYFGSPVTFGRVQLLCMQEGATGDGAVERWTEPSQDVDPTLAQHLISYDVLVALLGLQGKDVPNWFALGLAFQGVLAQYGVMGARLGADSVGDVTPPRQAFVPGGQANGGQFPQNVSSLRGTITARELRNFLEERKKAAMKLLDERDAKDPQRKAARSGAEPVFFNFRDTDNFEKSGYLHFGPYVGQDVSFLAGKKVGYDLALTQRAIFTLVAGELQALDQGAALSRLMAALPGATAAFEELFQQQTGTTPTELERAAFTKIKAK